VLTEVETASLVDEGLALEAARGAFTPSREDDILPVTVGSVAGTRNRFTVKAGSTAELVGAKIGSYWPENRSRGVPRHSSAIVLLDTTTGRIAAVVEAGEANAYRTAAADALAVQLLARADAEVLTVIGTGVQAAFEVRAVVRVRPIRHVKIVGRDREAAGELASRVGRSTRIPTEVVSVEEGCLQADVIVTATRAEEALFDARWVTPGTHVSAMGADGPGKRELPAALYGTARLFCDVVDQSRTIGEFQHASSDAVIAPLGDVLAGRVAGRESRDDITVFDSSGFVLQDLALASRLLARAESRAEER
jgi:ornithine cyclodeaminase